MKLIRAIIACLLLFGHHLMVCGQESASESYDPPLLNPASEPSPEDAPRYSNSSTVNSMEEEKVVNNPAANKVENAPDSEKKPESITNSTESSSTSRVRAIVPERAIYSESKTIPFNVKPGVNSKFYDQSELYSVAFNRSIPPFDVKAIYHEYLGRMRIQCMNYPQEPKIQYKDLQEAVHLATVQVQTEIDRAIADAKAGNIIASNVISADGRHLITGKLPTELKDFIDQEESSFMEYVAKNLQRKFCIRPVDVVERLTKIPPSALASKFLKCTRKHNNYAGNKLSCKNSRYRTYDGSCNNLEHTFWGKSNICHVRFLPPAYQDGLYLPRSLGVSGKPLPSPRSVSLSLHEEGEGTSFYTPWHFTWGQFVIHDIVSTPQSVPSHGSGVQCCPASKDDSKCLPIFLGQNDYQASKRKCINFIRSAPCPLCKLGPRQQLNLATSYIDHSAMYGADNQTVASLRTFKGGLLAVGLDKNRNPILPDSKSTLTDQCSRPALGKNHVCFRSGDARVNQQPFIQLIHGIFLRRHNQHARGLARVNPYASDEILFQEARRITIAELQHITYYEYLPVLLGPELGDYFEVIEKDTLFTEYEPDVDATTWNECAAAACRFGHSQITSFLSIKETKGASMNLKDSFFNPELIHSGLTPNLIATMLNSKAAVMDPFLTPSLKNFLYHHSGQDTFGSDLAAFNIQRGRDHGIPPYVDYVKFCFGFVVRSWKDLHAFMHPEHIAKLRKVYGDFRDIDLFTGGLYERKAIDADIGPTFACIVGIQFYHLKFGDRYFYTHSDQAGSFTAPQLTDMKNKFTLSNLLCLTEPQLNYAQRHAFLAPSPVNPNIDCKDVRKNAGLNYNLWRFRH